MIKRTNEPALLQLILIGVVLTVLFAQPVLCANGAATVDGIALGSSLAAFKMQVKKANIDGLQQVSDADDLGDSYTTDGIKIGKVNWRPEFEFVKDKNIQRMACIVGEVPKGDYSALLNAWNLGKTCNIALTRTHKFHNSDHLEFTHISLWEETLHGGCHPKWYDKWANY